MAGLGTVINGSVDGQGGCTTTQNGSAVALDVNVVQAVAKTSKTACGSISANTAIVALVVGKRIKVTAISWRTAYSAGTITPLLTDGNGGTTLWNDFMQAISGAISGAVVAKSEPAFICGTTAGTALYLNPNGQTVAYSISYFDDDAT